MTRNLFGLVLGTALIGIACVGPKMENEALAMAVRSPKCVQIFFDGNGRPEKQLGYGRRMALYLQNLLGHFVNIQQVLSPIELYKKGDLDGCPYNFYIGSQFDNALPADFIADVKTSPSSLVWMGYNVWQMGEDVFKERFGLQYNSIAEPDKNHLDPDGIPGFFRLHEYKGEVFKKYAKVSGEGTLEAVYDVVKTKPLNAKVKVVSWVQHSTLAERIPYITHHWNRWFVADVPFSYINEEDRYLIFADVLFDMIDEKPLRQDKLAIVRLEDVHPAIPEWQIRSFYEAAKRQQAKFVVSLIPIFKDPYHVLVPKEPELLPMGERPAFAKLLHEMQDAGVATVAMHGVTHQSDDQKNPAGVSGFDYEFWDILLNKPMPNDNAEAVVRRLEEGYKEMQKVGLTPHLWLTPHYAASTLDTAVFGQMFDWVVGRIIYTPFTLSQREKLPESMRLSRGAVGADGQRAKYFADLAIDVGKGGPTEQYFPYEIYGDVHDQKVLPENAGYLVPKKGVPPAVAIDRVLAVMKRNRVLRDFMGSLFIHPFLMGSIEGGGFGKVDGDTTEIERLFSEMRKMGYRFLSTKEWVASHREPIRPAPKDLH